MVYQGYRDHKEAIGSPEELIRRVFLQGLPSWLRELLALKEGDSVQSLVEASQRLWNARVGVSSHDEPPKLPAEPRRSGIAEISRDAPRTYRGSAYISDRHLFVGDVKEKVTFADSVPFRMARGEELHSPLGIKGARERSAFEENQISYEGERQLTEAAVQTVSEVSEITAQGPCGRPLVKIRVGGVAVTAFIDTGSEVTLLKMVLHNNDSKRIYHEGRGLRGVSGRLFEATSEWDVDVSFGNGRRIRKCCHRLCLVEGIDFPGDVLIGMDFLQRFCYQLVHNHTPQRDYLKLQGIILPITYAVGTTLGITAVAEFTPQNHCQKLALRRTTLCPPRSGRYVLVTVPQTFNDKEVILEAATDKVVVPRTVVVPENGTASVWVVNGGARPIHLHNWQLEHYALWWI
ncbi:hypothetical protein C7M84_001065 [Penaeus vannamei]|uniref:Retropepsins domain-containing protein n=1 Tax=Penaeus vannamei TaxID=6689 RepID=A0A3R7SXN9_PENVA|nr:hypothetical protein C7M84_001065 [Penaeus vannamei]